MFSYEAVTEKASTEVAEIETSPMIEREEEVQSTMASLVTSEEVAHQMPTSCSATEKEAHLEIEVTGTVASEEVLQEMADSEMEALVTETRRSKGSSEKASASIAKLKVIWLKIVQKVVAQEIMIDREETATKKGRTITTENEKNRCISPRINSFQ